LKKAGGYVVPARAAKTAVADLADPGLAPVLSGLDGAATAKAADGAGEEASLRVDVDGSPVRVRLDAAARALLGRMDGQQTVSDLIQGLARKPARQATLTTAFGQLAGELNALNKLFMADPAWAPALARAARLGAPSS